MKRLLLALAALLVGSVPAEAQTTQDVDITVTHGTACTGGPDRRSGRACRTTNS
jgi:hypothetical protein